MASIRGDDKAVAMGIRLTAAQKAWLDRESAKQDRSVTWLLRQLVDKAMAQELIQNALDAAPVITAPAHQRPLLLRRRA